MARGDHLVVRYPWGYHHGINLGDGTVMEYGGEGEDCMSIRRVPLGRFRRRGPVFVRRYPPGQMLDPDETERLAWARFREKRYDLFNNNCEHFAYWCKTGRLWSPQADRLKELLAVGAAVGLVALAVGDGDA
jgi:hypothetical protein